MAFNFKMDLNHIYSCSWGPEDDGKTVDGPHVLTRKAFEVATAYGRSGKGSVIVVASGNGGSSDSCSYDGTFLSAALYMSIFITWCTGYVNNPHTIPIGAIGQLGKFQTYGEQCAGVMAVTYGGDDTKGMVLQLAL
jgi:proprotein convertase subtilisin/kexin type 7